MALQIYNSLTKKKEELTPLNPKVINIYSCGVTVYDDCHIGHARSLYVFDVIRSYLKYRGFKVNFVRNITDVDDKIINKANELKVDWTKVVDSTIASYKKDLKSLGINEADQEPRATDNIPEMIFHIEGLIKKGIAYEADGDVYFSVRKFPEYGKLSGQSIEKMLEGVRIDKEAKKQDPLDFALWKKSKEGEPYWESPWGNGRPGWHIECSCMSMKYLRTKTLDIHAGGRDLIFPHHENEVAQSEALTEKPFAKYWIHHGLLTINAQKMSKSLGNFITIQDAIKKYDADTLKMFFLSSHYASSVDFNEEKIEDAKKEFERINILIQKLEKMNLTSTKVFSKELLEFQQQFMDSMDDDFNTPKALASLFDLVRWTNKVVEGNDEKDADVLAQALGLIKECVAVFGLNFQQDSLSQEEKDLLDQRKQARLDKDYQKSDELRDKLTELGIIVEDGKDGQTWRRA